ncbi:MAG: hypothetical protein ACRCW3_03720 [Metamycoplasmataceae bacterium]
MDFKTYGIEKSIGIETEVSKLASDRKILNNTQPYVDMHWRSNGI